MSTESTSAPRRGRPALLVAGVLLVAVVLCDLLIVVLGRESESSAAPKQPRIEIAVRPPSKVPTLKPAARQPTEAGATAFVLFWFDTLNYSLAHLDTELLAPHTGSGCRQCTGYLIGLQRWKQGGSRLEGGLTVPVDLALGPFSTREPVAFASTFLTTPATITDSSGAATDYPGARTRGGVTVLWTGDRWQLTDFVLDISKALPGP